MRSLIGCLLLAAALAPAALAFSVGDSARAEAVRCAIACGHAAAASEDAACCPMARSSDGPTWNVCPGSDGRSIAPPIQPQPALLSSRFRLAPLPGMRPLEESAPAPVSRRAVPPDHVPLLS